MSKSTTTHRAALKALENLLGVTLDLESRISSLGESGVFDYDPDRGKAMRDLCERASVLMGRAQRVIDDTNAVTPEARYTALRQAKLKAKAELKASRAK